MTEPLQAGFATETEVSSHGQYPAQLPDEFQVIELMFDHFAVRCDQSQNCALAVETCSMQAGHLGEASLSFSGLVSVRSPKKRTSGHRPNVRALPPLK